MMWVLSEVEERLFLRSKKKKGQKKGQGERDRTKGMNEYVTERGERDNCQEDDSS